MLDVGCGHGTLLQDMAVRGARGVGITLSEKQAAWCGSRGLDVEVRNWNALGDARDGQFDAVIASGSLEHFVSPRDHQRQDDVYRAFFRKCHELLDAATSTPRLVVTTCVFHRRFSTKSDGPWKKHLLNLGYFMDGCYPKSIDSLLACSAPLFRLVERRETTRDYLLTSLHWKKRLVDSWSPRKALVFARVVAGNAAHPIDLYMALKFFRDGSWIWQFDGHDPPVRHYQLVLERVP